MCKIYYFKKLKLYKYKNFGRVMMTLLSI